jgi:hypothetical protein
MYDNKFTIYWNTFLKQFIMFQSTLESLKYIIHYESYILITFYYIYFILLKHGGITII